jgi:hypothetical protein
MHVSDVYYQQSTHSDGPNKKQRSQSVWAHAICVRDQDGLHQGSLEDGRMDKFSRTTQKDSKLDGTYSHVIWERVELPRKEAMEAHTVVIFEVITAVTMKNAVFWDIKPQFVPHRSHITSPLQRSSG